MSETPCDVLDLTHGQDETEGQEIRLKQGLDVRSLLADNEGVIFEPEMDALSPDDQDKDDRNYFIGASKDQFEEMMSRLETQDQDSEGEDEDPERTPFENKAAKMKDLLPDGGVKKRMIRSGLETFGCVPDRGTVVVHYSLYLEGQDEPCDSTTLRGRAERYRLDVGSLLLGVELAIKSMKKKEKAEFLLEPDYAFGRMGCPPRIPQKAQILAKIELIDFAKEAEAEALLAIPPEDRVKEKSFGEIEKVAKDENKEGTEYVKGEEWKMAAKRYGNGIKLLEDCEMANEGEEERQKKLLLKLYLNRSHCNINVQFPKKACLDLQKALEIEPSNPKALFRLGKAKRMLGNDNDAMRLFQKALRVRPGDTDIGREISSLNAQMSRERANERALYERMMPGARMQETERPIDLEDEMKEEITEQFKNFKKNPIAKTMPIPSSFDENEIAFCRLVAKDMDLVLKSVQNDQWMLSKKSV